MLAPDAVSVVLAPAQIADAPATVTVGVALTVTVTLDVSLHPEALVPVTL